MIRGIALAIFTLLFLPSCHKDLEKKTILCIPVYGQSLALGEEAGRMTDFDSLSNYANGRIVSENLDHNFGYFDNNEWKEWGKKIVHYQKRSYELSVYKMAQRLAEHIGKDTLICIFPGGQGGTDIANLSKGTIPYQHFIDNIKDAYTQAQDNGWDFVIPAICWMQGESDIADYPNTDYKKMLIQIWKDMNADIQHITHSKDTIRFICYQANSLTRAEKFKPDDYECIETCVPQTFVDILLHDSRFWASGPTYPYSCVREVIHIDAKGQQQIGALAAKSVLGIMRGEKRFQGLIPTCLTVEGNDVAIKLNTPTPPLTFDTIQVRKVPLYGFSVINKENHNIATKVTLDDESIRITCSESPKDCKVRYAVNGEYMKSGKDHGPRGNLRDNSNNWCYQFDMKPSNQ